MVSITKLRFVDKVVRPLIAPFGQRRLACRPMKNRAVEGFGFTIGQVNVESGVVPVAVFSGLDFIGAGLVEVIGPGLWC